MSLFFVGSAEQIMQSGIKSSKFSILIRRVLNILTILKQMIQILSPWYLLSLLPSI